jgi:hypothetical protein
MGYEPAMDSLLAGWGRPSDRADLDPSFPPTEARHHP